MIGFPFSTIFFYYLYILSNNLFIMSIVGIIATVSAVSITLGSGIIVYGVYLLVSSVRSEEVHNVKKVEAKAKAEVKVLHQSEETAKRLQHRDLRALAAVRLERACSKILSVIIHNG